jgi:recombination protein RecT
MANTDNLPILKEEKKALLEYVVTQVTDLEKDGRLKFPAEYAVENALRAAWLKIQDVQDLQKRPALDVCTRLSISNALYRMAVYGLSPTKDQCYFIVYGDKLQMQTSYFGEMHLAKSVDKSIKDIYAQAIYKNDDFQYIIRDGVKNITKHEQKFENIKNENIIGAYAVVIYDNGDTRSEIMTMEEIKAAWKKSKMNPVDENGNLKPNSTHAQFTAAMVKKTVIRRLCNPIIKSSDDSNIIKQVYVESEREMKEVITEAEIDENANTIDMEVIDAETGEVISDTVKEIDLP